MSIRLPKNTTLGELIVAMTDKVTPLTHDSGNANILVSYIVRDLVATRRVRLQKHSELKYVMEE